MNPPHYEQLRADLLRRMRRRDPEHAEDLVQEVLLRVHRKLSEPVEIERIDAWVGRVARNVWIDHLRRERPSELLEEQPVPATEPEATGAVAAWLPGFVGALPEPYRTAVRRVDLEGLSQADLARELQISQSGARSRVQRGRELLKGELLGCCAVEWSEGEVVDVQRRCGC